MSEKNLNWQKIYLDHSPKLLGICRRYIPDIFAAEDIVHDSFIAAIQKKAQLKDEKAIFGWLKIIVVNNALQYLRKQSKETILNKETPEIHDNHAEMEQNFLEEKHILAYDFTREQLLQSIDSLPSHHKSVFNLYFIENYSHAEISKSLEIPVNTSKSHLMRAKKSVQNYLITHFVKTETPKNKIALLLIFLGFGNSLWGRTFKSKFSDFVITPEKSFEISTCSNENNVSISSAQNLWKQNLIIGGTVVVIVTGSMLIFKTKNNAAKITSPNISKSNLKENKPQVSAVEMDSADKIQSNPVMEDVSVSEVSAPEKITILKSDTKLSSENSKKQTEHSAEKPVQQIVVVKKVIQRDTVFIER